MALTLALRRRSVATLAALAAVATWLVANPAAPATGTTFRPAIVDPALRAAHGTVGVIVTGTRSAESAVVKVGGRITHDLPIIGGFSATVPANDISLIARMPGVRGIALD